MVIAMTALKVQESDVAASGTALTNGADVTGLVYGTSATGTVRYQAVKAKGEVEIEVDRRSLEKKLNEGGTKNDQYARRSLFDHLDDWKHYLETTPAGERYVSQVYGRVHRILMAAGVKVFADVTVSKIQKAIAEQKIKPQRVRGDSPSAKNRRKKPEAYKPMSQATKNHCVVAVRQFFSWLVREGRFGKSPVAALKTSKVVHLKHERTGLSDQEFVRLIEAARKSTETIEGFDGIERARLYAIAAATGLRRRELASLTPGSFKLGDSSTVTVEAACSKHRYRDVLAIHPDLASAVREWTTGLAAGDLIFPGLQSKKTFKMMKRDLKAAKLPYLMDGKFRDFHSLRHRYITKLCESCERPDVIMSMARHRSLAMTMRYTHPSLGDQAEVARRHPVAGLEEALGGG